MQYMFLDTVLTAANYNALLIGWTSQNVQDDVTFTAVPARYSSVAVNSRNHLTGIHNWNIEDGGFISDPNITFVNPTTSAGEHTQNFITTNVSVTNASLILNLTIYLYNDSDLVSQNSTTSNKLFWNITGLSFDDYYLNASVLDNEGLTNQTETLSITLNENTPPQIISVYNSTEMTSVASGPNEGPVATYVQLNITAYDEQGFGNLNNSAVQVNFSRAGENSRINSSCALLADYNTNYANYTCNVTMWWWDAPGTWKINASISDLDGNHAFNDSTTFAIGSTTGFLANSSTVGWPSISPGATNIEANAPMLLNNTGNQQISVEVNATNLTGENNPAYSLGASNFSVHTSPGCEGTPMFWYRYTTVVGATIPRGNYSRNDGTAQETIYFCLEQSNANLIAQPYSTAQQGVWTIKIFLALLTVAKRRKRKKKIIENDNLLKAMNLIADELKEEYSLNKKEVIEIVVERLKKKYSLTRNELLEVVNAREGITIPITIFTKELGGLEAVVKYMKENLNMNYREIAREIERDERTIWTAYKKACEKQKEHVRIKETEINLPISIFENKKLTILEAIIIYLKEKGKKYSEIAKLLDRDPRNIWTIYSKAINKI
jgi:hypothetical protein